MIDGDPSSVNGNGSTINGSRTINFELEHHFAKRNMRIKSSHDTNRQTSNNFRQTQQINKLNLDSTLVEIKSVYSPLSVTRYNQLSRESRMNSPTNANSPSSPRNFQEVPNSLMVQDSKNIELMNEKNIIKLSYLPKLHRSLNHRKMRMDQYSSPWDQIKKIAQFHNTPVLFEQHSIFGTSLTGFDGNIAIKPLIGLQMPSSKTDQNTRKKNDSNIFEGSVLKNEKIRLNMTLHESGIRSAHKSQERESFMQTQQQQQIQQPAIMDTYRDIQIEKEKKEKTKQILDQNQQQFLQKFWTSKFSTKGEKQSLKEQQNAKKKIYDRQLEGINRSSTSRQQNGNQSASKDKYRSFSLASAGDESNNLKNQRTISIMQQQQQHNQITPNNYQNLQLNLQQSIPASPHYDHHSNLSPISIQQQRVSTADQKTKIYFFQRKPQISPRKLELLQNKLQVN